MADLRIPLFPLNVVLFPGMELPLKVFEERYHLMLTECLDPEAVRLVQEVLPEERVASPPALGYFGVAMTEDPEVGAAAKPALVGTLARITSVGAPAPERALTAVGVRRFRVDRLHEKLPYLEADVTFLDMPEPGAEAEEAARAAVAGFERYVEAMVVSAPPEFGKVLLALSPGIMGAPPREAAWRIAEALLVPIPEKQALLETDSWGKLLDLEARLLAREIRKSRLLDLSRNAHLN